MQAAAREAVEKALAAKAAARVAVEGGGRGLSSSGAEAAAAAVALDPREVQVRPLFHRARLKVPPISL